MTGPFGPPLKRVSRSSTSSSVLKKWTSAGPHRSGRCSRGGASGLKALGRAKTPPKVSLSEPANIRPNFASALELVERASPPTPFIVVSCLAKSAMWMVTMPLAATGPSWSPSWTVT